MVLLRTKSSGLEFVSLYWIPLNNFLLDTQCKTMTALTLQGCVWVWQCSAAVTTDVTTLMPLILIKITSFIMALTSSTTFKGYRFFIGIPEMISFSSKCKGGELLVTEQQCNHWCESVPSALSVVETMEDRQVTKVMACWDCVIKLRRDLIPIFILFLIDNLQKISEVL